MKIYKILALMLIMASLGLFSPAGADGIIIIEPPPDAPFIKLDQALTIKYHHVEVEIKDQVATTRVDQVFVNDNPWTAEGTYIFPLPEGAAVSNFVMWVDGQPIQGEILEADQARAIYNDIVQRMRDPALLEYVGRKALKASIFPIPPGEQRRIQLEYSQVLTMDGGLVHYLYPLSTERYSARPLEEMTIMADVESKAPIKAFYSPSHDAFINRSNDYHAKLRLEQSNVLPDKDFELYYTVSPEKVGLNLLSFKEPEEDGFFLLLAAPSVEVDPGEVVAKDVILALDTSGSMSGEKLDQAKAATQYVLQHLKPNDRFNIVAFSSDLKSFSSRLEPSSKAEEAADFVGRLEALAMTDINRALLEALGMADSGRPTILIFLTDGLPTEGVTETSSILENVKDTAFSNVRIFSFGVGDDVDTDLLDQLSLDHGGISTYVRPGQKIDEEVSAFYAKVSTPVLSEVQMDFLGVAVDRLFPREIPDLFAGTQLVLVGRYSEGGPATVKLAGTVNGKSQNYTYKDLYFRKDGGEEFISRLWATRAIGYYLTQIRLEGEKPELVDTIVSLSLRYGIITPYTSFLVQEKDIFSQAGRQQIIEDAEQSLKWHAAEPSYGAPAVERAAFEGQMASGALPAALPRTMNLTVGYGGEQIQQTVEVAKVVKQVGSKTFVLRNDTWIDTAYNASMKTAKVGFLSQDYFDLIAAVPMLGDYFALGSKVIAVYGGTVYEVVEGPGEKIAIPEKSAP